MGSDTFLTAFAVLVPMILSLTVHEYAHAWAAKALGDDTAERMGRLNLNPLSHIDPFGTVILPLMILLLSAGLPFFGWAKPVPVDPTRFRRTVTVQRGMMLTAAAGPLANVVLALLSQGAIAALFHQGLLSPGPVAEFLLSFRNINIALALFNMIPIFPLDGQKVLSGLLPPDLAIRFERFNMQFGSMLLIFIIMFAGRLLSVPFTWAMRSLAYLFGMPLL